MKKMKYNLINLTPHEIRVMSGKDVVLVVPRSGIIARVKTENKVCYTLPAAGFIWRHHVATEADIPVVTSSYGEIEYIQDDKKIDLPHDPNTKYIVSKIVLDANSNQPSGKRSDLICPDTSPTGSIRDEKGQIIGVKGFQI